MSVGTAQPLPQMNGCIQEYGRIASTESHGLDIVLVVPLALKVPKLQLVTMSLWNTVCRHLGTSIKKRSQGKDQLGTLDDRLSK